MLTIYYHRDAQKAWDSRADQSQAASPPATQQFRVHHEHTDDVRRNLQRPGHKSVNIDVTMQSSGVQGKSVIDQTACQPTFITHTNTSGLYNFFYACY